MAADTPIDVGFAEFVATLLAETMDAVSVSLAEQEERRAEMLTAVSLDIDDFAAEFVLDQEVEALAQTRLGMSELKIGIKAPAATRLLALGVTLAPADRQRTRGPLTASGVAAIRSALRHLIASERQAAWRELNAQGLPRLVVDHGRVLAKLTFQVISQEDKPLPKSKPKGRSLLLARSAKSRKSASASRSVAAAIPAAIRNLRVGVRSASAEEPDRGETRTDVYGEVEIGFRTVF